MISSRSVNDCNTFLNVPDAFGIKIIRRSHNEISLAIHYTVGDGLREEN